MTPFEQRQFAELVAEIVVQKLRDNPMDGFLDGHQAAQLMKCSHPTIERLTRDGKIPSHKIGRLRRYRASELLEAGRNGVMGE
jgi:excisionase family DNA binding protein